MELLATYFRTNSSKILHRTISEVEVKVKQGSTSKSSVIKTSRLSHHLLTNLNGCRSKRLREKWNPNAPSNACTLKSYRGINDIVATVYGSVI